MLWCVSAVLLATFAVPGLQAQYAKPPDTYSLTEINSMMISGVNVQIYRDGSKALVDQSVQGPNPFHTHTLYDLQTQRSYIWVPGDDSAPCGAATFSGDWGDPFAASAEMNTDLAKMQPTAAGEAVVNGIATKILEATIPGGTAKLWVETKYGLMIRWEANGKNGQPKTMLEVKQLSFARPAASLFTLPASCAQVANSPRVPSEEERIAAETGGKTGDFTNAIMPPASKNSCTVLFRIVRAGTMETISSGFQLALDTNVDFDHPASYSTGLSSDGHATFSGGSLHEVTSQFKNGVLRIDQPPPQFNMELYFGKAGDSSALIYRQCFGPQTTLLFVIKNPDKLSDGGDWLWDKAGKFAGEKLSPK